GLALEVPGVLGEGPAVAEHDGEVGAVVAVDLGVEAGAVVGTDGHGAAAQRAERFAGVGVGAEVQAAHGAALGGESGAGAGGGESAEAAAEGGAAPAGRLVEGEARRGGTAHGPFLRSGNERPVSNSGATPPQINCIVHLKWVFSPVLLAQVDLGEVGREFDAEDGGEVVAFPERPPDRQGLAGEAVPGPEPFDGLRVVLGQAPPEPAAECGPGGVVVDDEDGAAAADDPAEFGEAGFAAGAEEVRPPGVGDVDGGVRK